MSHKKRYTPEFWVFFFFFFLASFCGIIFYSLSKFNDILHDLYLYQNTSLRYVFFSITWKNVSKECRNMNGHIFNMPKCTINAYFSIYSLF